MEGNKTHYKLLYEELFRSSIQKLEPSRKEIESMIKELKEIPEDSMPPEIQGRLRISIESKATELTKEEIDEVLSLIKDTK